MTFQTMTLGGCYGSDIEADSADEAAEAAERMGYEVLDVMDDLIVVAD